MKSKPTTFQCDPKFCSDLPIIAQTACSPPEVKNKAKRIGCNDFISKPINELKLFTSLNEFLNLFEFEQYFVYFFRIINKNLTMKLIITFLLITIFTSDLFPLPQKEQGRYIRQKDIVTIGSKNGCVVSPFEKN